MGFLCDANIPDDDASTPLVTVPTSEDNNAAGPFYSADCVLDIPKSVAEGYFALITGGSLAVPHPRGRSKRSKKHTKKGKKNKARLLGSKEFADGDDATTSLDDSADDIPDHLAISWMSVLDGNVVDSCFGVTANGGTRFTAMMKPGKKKGSTRQIIREADSRTVKQIKKAKAQLADVAELHPAVKILALEAYGNCMCAVIDYHERRKEYGFLTPLLCSRNKSNRDRSLEAIRLAFEHLTGAVEASL